MVAITRTRDDGVVPAVPEGQDLNVAGKSNAGVEEVAEIKKFKHLLEPIRNLADNWSIDIANELEGYLEDLEALCMEGAATETQSSVEGGERTSQLEEGAEGKFSFAKAALLVQGSTYVYSKKVEYLYTLVLDCIDKIMTTSKKRALQRRMPDAASGDDIDEDRFLLEGEEEKYLNLDDLIDQNMVVTGQSIELQPDDVTTDAMAQEDLERENHSHIMLALQPQSAADAGGSGSMEDRGCFNLSGLTVHQKTGALLLEGVEPLIESQDDVMGAPDEGPFSPHEHLDLHLSLSPQSEANGGAPMDHGDPQEGFTPMVAAEDAYAGQEEEDDPYAPLDPTEVCQWNPKPFRRGNLQMKLASEEESDEGDEDQETWFTIPKTSDFAQQARRSKRSKAAAFAIMEEENENEEDFQLAGMTEDLVDFGAVSDHEDFDFDVDAAGADRGETTSGAAPEAHRGGLDAGGLPYAAPQLDQTKLAQRVAEWKQRVEPAIAECETHKSFDIQEYRALMLETVNVDEEIEDSLPQVEAEEKFEVARKFLLLLMLKSN